MDSEVEDLKQEVEELKRISVDTNRVIHGMRRGQRWRSFFSVVWWVAIIAVSGASYYYYVQPYVAQAIKSYDNAKDFQVQLQNLFAKFGQTGTQ